MGEQHRASLITYMVAGAVSVSLAFNIDVTHPDLYKGEQKDFFGYKVLQFMSGTHKGIIVTAPLQLNGTGGICRPDGDQITKCFNPQELSVKNKTIPVKHLGLTMVPDSTRSQFTACSPSVAHECNENSYLNSVCYKMSDDLEQISSFKPGFQECTKKTVDLAFLFDGSASMNSEDFQKNKYFIVDIMNSLKNTSIKFAAVQFGTKPRTVFDFNDYDKGKALKKLQDEPHMSSLTNTHQALTFVLKNIFESKAAGATPDATKVLVLITDGDPSDSDSGRIIKTYDEKSIIRLVIGVKILNLNKVKTIASDPKDKNAFRIENYGGLKGMLENFQKKIFVMEGSKVARAGDMTNEMSQSGFSAVFHKETLILGSVGSNSWRGSLYQRQGQTEKMIEDPLMQMDSYMGYSVSAGERNDAPLYFTGAPRFEHIGQVVMFSHDGKKWNTAQRINGDQIGSYFGAELCSVDINSDGDSDFLLVGAPLSYDAQEKTEGQVNVYSLTDEMQLKSELNLTAPSMGRFGTTITSLADLNGDGLRDVAVGAPLEDGNGGVVYIYLGDKHRGIRSLFSQRIMGQKINPGLRYFGQAIDGSIDLGDDGLPDIVVGSYGAAVVLSSRPVFNVIARLSFQPEEIDTDNIDCSGNTDIDPPMFNLTACFEVRQATNSRAGVMNSGLKISYKLDVDPNRQTSRGFFNQTVKKDRTLTSVYVPKDNGTCLNYVIYLPKCVKDILSPISIKLNFSQVDSERASAVLNADGQRQAAIEVPFKKECRTNDICVAELEVDFNFTQPTLLVAEDNYFKISIKLSNHGDDSYNTSLTIHYPPGLSFSRMSLTESTRPTLHSCNGLEGVLDKTTCGVSRPVYRSRSSATFITSFYVMTDYNWNDTISISVTGDSDNTNSFNASLTKSLPVQFQIKMAVIVKEDTVTYLNFTAEDPAPKKLHAIYKVDNPGLKAFPVNVSLFFPTKLEHTFEMRNYQVSVQENKTQCTDISNTTSEYCSPEKNCKLIVCESFILEKESATEFILSGDVVFRDLKDQAANAAFLKRYTGDSAEVKFKSFIVVDYDRQQYVLDSHKQQNEDGSTLERNKNDPTMRWTEVRIEFLILPDQLLIISTGVGVGVLLLLILALIMFKLGCFKRKTVDEFYKEQEEEAAQQAGSPTETLPQSALITDQPAEEKKLLLSSDPSPDEKTALD